MRKKEIMKKLTAVVMAAGLVLSMAGCGNDGGQSTSESSAKGVSAESTGTESSTSQSSTSQAEEPDKEPVDQDKEIIFAASRDQAPGEKDAYYCSFSLGVWEPLITKDDSGAPVPALAESWTHNEDSTEWTFQIRQGVEFSNGTPLTADIVKQNFDRYAQGPFESSFYGINIETMYPGLTGVYVDDTYTLRLTFEQPQPLLDYLMVNFNSCIFEPSCFAEDGNFNGPAIGTGPFVIKENVLGEYCVIERNENYYGEPAKAKTIRFRVIPDPDTRYSALRSGEVQGLCDLGAITPVLAAEIQDDPDYTVLVGDSGITHYLNVNGNRFPFNDVRMREGLSLLLDREEIINEFYNGYGIPAGAFLNYTSAFYKEIPVQHDVEKGKELIKEAIGDQQVTLDFLIPVVDANRYPYEEEAVYIQSILGELGIQCNITKMEWDACKEKMKAQDYDMCLKIQGMSSADPFSLFKGFMYSEGGTNINYGLGYHNEEVDQLIDSVSSLTSVEDIQAVYDRLQDISAEDFPNIPVSYAQEVAACSSKIEGYEATTYGLEGYTQVQWVE